MDKVAEYFLGAAALVLLIWGASELNARIFFRYGEKFLKDKSNNLKTKQHEQQEKK